VARENVPGEEHEATLRPTTASVNAETVLGFALGTPEYMSPEQAEGMWDHIGPTSDVYSLGATLYHALTGQPSVTGADLSEKLSKIQSGGIHWPRTINRQIPFALDAICRKAMALRPVDRYQTVRALADDIEHWLADEPVAACHENLIERSARWARRHKTRVAVLVVAGMFVMASLALVASVAGVKNRELDISNRQLKSSNQQLQAARSDAVAAAQRESLERRKSDLAAARSLFEQGYTRHQERSASNGMLLMVRALEQPQRVRLWIRKYARLRKECTTMWRARARNYYRCGRWWICDRTAPGKTSTLI
jgi:serine/threonine protein kinase